MDSYIFLFFGIKGFFQGFYETIKFLQPIFVAISTLLTIWIVVKSWPRKYSPNLDSSELLVINWSGHPLPKADWLQEAKVWNPQRAPHFNTDDWDSLMASVQKLLVSLPKEISMRLLHGDPRVVIVIPQLAVGAVILVASIHGFSGSFPTITSPVQGKDGDFFLPPPISLREIRSKFRDLREI